MFSCLRRTFSKVKGGFRKILLNLIFCGSLKPYKEHFVKHLCVADKFLNVLTKKSARSPLKFSYIGAHGTFRKILRLVNHNWVS